MRTRQTGSVAAALLLASVGCVAAPASSQTLRIVAVSGEQAPGMEDGVTFLVLSQTAAVDNAPDGLFRALLTGPGISSDNQDSYWDSNGPVSLLLQAGTEAPGSGGLLFRNFAPIRTDGPNHYSFRAGLSDGSQGIWANRPGTLEFVVRDGDQAPDRPQGTTIRALGYPAIGSGVVAFSGRLRTPEGTSLETIFFDRWGSLESTLVQGELAPGTDRPIVRFDSVRLGRSGQSVVGMQLDRYTHGLWTDRSGAFRVLAMEGEEAPGWGGADFGDNFSDAVVNAEGGCAFTAKIDIGGTWPAGTFTDRSGAVEPVAVWKQQAPGTPPGTQFGVSQSDLLINNHGHVAFAAGLTGDGTNEDNGSGVWADRPDGELDLLVRTGDRLPEAPDDTWIRVSARRLEFNNAYDVVLHAELDGSNVDYTNDEAILGFAALGDPVLLLREGQVLELGEGDHRTVFDFEVESRLTDDGRIYVFVEFTDATRAVLELTVPETGACPADLSGDGVVDTRDFIEFLSAWADGDPIADWNADGQVDSQDFLAYLNDWAAGCG